jgi:hypothetical protein
MSSHTTLRRRAPSPVSVRTIGLAIAGLLALLLFAETASRALEPAIRAMPSYLLDGLTSPAALAQRTT